MEAEATECVASFVDLYTPSTRMFAIAFVGGGCRTWNARSRLLLDRHGRHRQRRPKCVRASLVGPRDAWSTWASLTVAAAVGMRAERTAVGKSLTTPVCAMLITAALVNLHILPAQNYSLGGIQRSVATLTTPLLLLDADLRRVSEGAGKGMLLAFVVAAVSTCVGGIFAYAGILRFGLPLDWRVCSALIAKNVGGGLNYVAVSATLGIPAEVIAAGLTVDNIIGLIYFPTMSYFASNSPITERRSHKVEVEREDHDDDPDPPSSRSDAGSLLTALSFASVIVATSERLAVTFMPGASLPIATAITVTLSTFLPERLEGIRRSAKSIGQILLYIYFASAGAGGGSITQIATCLPLFAFCACMYFIHVLAIAAALKFLPLETEEAFLASNASIGGPATASAMAIAKGWTTFLVPAILVGNLGNAVATFLALFIGRSILYCL